MTSTMIDEREWSAQASTGAGADWADHFLSEVPTDAIGRNLVLHAIQQVTLALGPRYCRTAVPAILRDLAPMPGSASGAAATSQAEIDQRVSDGDVSLLDDERVEIDWLDITAEHAFLFGYALYGDGSGRSVADARERIQSVIKRYQALAANSSACSAIGTHLHWITDLLSAAEARWELDHDRPVPPLGLAVLAGVKPKTMANILAAHELATDSRGYVLPDEARRYLTGRESFIPSTWQTPDAYPDGSMVGAPSLPEEQVFVPVDAEGRPFLPNLVRMSRDGSPRYAIGPKDAPVYVQDYWEALRLLAQMESPRWRRPPATGKGGWSLVSAQEGWRRFPRAELERMISTIKATQGPASPRED